MTDSSDGVSPAESTFSLARRPTIKGFKEAISGGQRVKAEGLHLAILPRSEFVPKETEANCMQCSKRFFALRKRHHCRCCGHVLCAKCSQYRIRLRLCSGCYGKAQDIVGEEHSDDEDIGVADPGDTSVLDEVDALQEAVMALQQELRRQTEDATSAREKLEGSESTVEALKAQLADAWGAEEVEKLKGIMSDMQQQLAAEKERRKKAEESTVEAKDMGSRWKKKAASKESEVVMLQSTVDKLKSQVRKVEAEARAADDSRVEEAQQTSAGLKAERDTAVAELTAAKKELKLLREKLASASSVNPVEVQRQKKEAATLRKELKHQRSSCESMSKELEKLRATREKVETKAATLTKRSSQLELQLTSRDDNVQQLSEALVELQQRNAQLKEELAAAKQEAESTSTLEQVDALKEMVAEANTRAETLANTTTQLEMELTECKAVAASQTEALATEVSELKGKLGEHQQTEASLKEQLVEAQATVGTTEEMSTKIAALESEVIALETQVAESNTVQQEAEKQVKKTKAEAELLRMKLQRAHTQSRKTKANQASNVEARLQEAEAEAAQLREQVAKPDPAMEAKLEDLKTKLHAANQALKVARTNHRQAEASLKSRIKNLESKCQDLEEQVTRLTEEIERLKAKLAAQQQKRTAEQRKLQAEVATLQSALDEREEFDREKLSNDQRIHRLQERAAKKEAEVATLKTQIDHLKQSLAAAESKLKRSDQAKANEAYNTKNELQQLRKQIRTLTAEKANLMATARAKSNLDGPAPPRIQGHHRRSELDDHLDQILDKADPSGTFSLTKLSEGLYQASNGKKLAIRMAGGVVMVRVGGGWQNLEEYLTSNLARFFHHSKQDEKVRYSVERAQRYKHGAPVSAQELEGVLAALPDAEALAPSDGTMDPSMEELDGDDTSDEEQDQPTETQLSDDDSQKDHENTDFSSEEAVEEVEEVEAEVVVEAELPEETEEEFPGDDIDQNDTQTEQLNNALLLSGPLKLDVTQDVLVAEESFDTSALDPLNTAFGDFQPELERTLQDDSVLAPELDELDSVGFDPIEHEPIAFEPLRQLSDVLEEDEPLSPLPGREEVLAIPEEEELSEQESEVPSEGQDAPVRVNEDVMPRSADPQETPDDDSDEDVPSYQVSEDFEPGALRENDSGEDTDEFVEDDDFDPDELSDGSYTDSESYSESSATSGEVDFV